MPSQVVTASSCLLMLLRFGSLGCLWSSVATEVIRSHARCRASRAMGAVLAFLVLGSGISNRRLRRLCARLTIVGMVVGSPFLLGFRGWWFDRGNHHSLSLWTVRADVTGLATSVTDWCSLFITSIGSWFGTDWVGQFWWCRPGWHGCCWFMTSSFPVPVPRWDQMWRWGSCPCGHGSQR